MHAWQSAAWLHGGLLCRTADDALLERARSGHASSATRLDLDPWMTESRVVAAHQALHSAQVTLAGTAASL